MNTWKYLKGMYGSNLTKKHSVSKGTNRAICGEYPKWFQDEWLEDEEGLAQREECKKCVKWLQDGILRPGSS